MDAVTARRCIVDYYAACNRGDVEALAALFTEDVVHYFLAPNLAPRAVAGRDHLARYWRKVQAAFDGCWVVDHLIADEAAEEAVIEWTLFWTPPDTGVRVATRGAEWYVFEGGLIKEIRAYYRQDPAQTSELEGFPYAERGYSLPGAERSAVQPQPR
ncbi:MAG: nuclear transport factor 2 family protein [Acidimicrobiales bacterium]|nr:nuclear transport factor 2 family protein [Acidimicrobiales bacterium]